VKHRFSDVQSIRGAHNAPAVPTTAGARINLCGFFVSNKQRKTTPASTRLAGFNLNDRGLYQ
jgi:hypothetical protein